MNTRIATIVALLLLVFMWACTPADPNNPSPPGSVTVGETDINDTMNGTGGMEPTTGGECEMTFAQYQCHGFVAGIYSTDAAPTTYRFTNMNSPGGELDAYQCLDSSLVTLCSDQGAAFDTEMLAAQCKYECEENMNWDGFPATHGDWHLRGIHCEFQLDVNNGYVHSDIYGLVGGPTSPGCASAGDMYQMPKVGGPEACEGEEACNEAHCESWKPTDYVTSRLKTSTATYTTTIDYDYLFSIFAYDYNSLYTCDGARYKEWPAGTWKIANAASGDLLYVMGFRTGDHTFKIRKGNCSTCSWITLNSYANMGDALTLLIDEPVLQIQFKRTTGTTTTTYTMNLSII